MEKRAGGGTGRTRGRAGGPGSPGRQAGAGRDRFAARKSVAQVERGCGHALAKMSATAAPMKPKNGAEAGQRSDDILMELRKFASAEG